MMTPKNLRITSGQMTNCLTWYHNHVTECSNFGPKDRFVFIHSGWPVIRGDHKKPLPHGYEYSSAYGESVYRKSFDDHTSVFTTGPAKAATLPLIESTTAYNNALEKLNDKVRGGLDISVDAFQARQTARMFSATAQAEDLARGLRRLGVGKLKLLGSLRLQLQYGWLPTLSTIYGIADESLRYIANNLSTYRGKSTSTDTGVFTVLDTAGQFSVGVSSQRKTQVQIAVTVDNSKVLNLSRWTSLNPVSIGWEVLPGSFVVDWFFDVGSYLREAETALLYGRAFKSGFVSTYRESRGSGGVRTSQKYGFSNFDGKASRVQFSRSVLRGYPFPQRPKLNFSLSSGRLLNAAALLSQFLR